MTRSRSIHSSLITEESACKKLTFVVLGCFPVIFRHLFCIMWSFGFLDLCVCSQPTDNRNRWLVQCMAMYSWSSMTCERLLRYPSRRCYSQEFLLISSWLCRLRVHSSVVSDRMQIPMYFTFLDQGIEWLNNLSLGGLLWERIMKSIAVVLSRLIEALNFVSLFSRSDVGRTVNLRW
jgi:hypothetical protein